MAIKKVTYLIIILMLACTTGMAQTMTFTMSPIASSSNGFVTSGGNPAVVDGNGKCLNVQTGLAVLNVNTHGKGVFGSSCVEVAPAAVISITSVNVYPNPTHGISILKCEGSFDANLSCQVRIMTIDGRMMMNKMVPMKDVQAGYTLDLSSYAAGTYVVTVDFANQHYPKKLIKL